ncbi:MAG: nucleotidyltransferase domain-containing protein [Chitinivibrionales bacterium]|nr:nucleotidyltransferase domain-containing protein [Chitinivibrionales bacterium]
MRELTKNRAALLRLFYTNPDQSYYMQEIGRILNKKPGYFQRTLNKMVDEGILISELRANARYFKVNKDYPLYEELKSIVFKTVGVLGSIREVMQKLGNVEYCYIYGSYAKGKETSLSDIDLVVIGDVDEDKFIKGLDKLEQLLKREVNYKLYTMIEFRRAKKKREPFLMEILQDRKIMVIGEEGELRKVS